MVSDSTRPCRCGGCHLCRLYATSPRHRAAWGGGAVPRQTPKPAAVALPCAHEGRPAPPPPGADPRKAYYRCDAGLGVVCRCRCGPGRCDRYEPDGPGDAPPVRHLLCHLLPVAGNGVWRRTVDHLRARRHLFDGGRRAVAVLTGRRGARPALDPPGAVRAYAGDLFTDVIEVPNDPGRREVATWAPLLAAVLPRAGDADAVFYCHSKGATRPVDPGNMCHPWADLMFSVNLDRPALVAAVLARHHLAGAFQKVGPGFGEGGGAWHYSGTFFWARAASLKARRHVRPPAAWWGVEAWPGVAFATEEAACLFLPGVVPTLDVYCPGYWRDVILPEYARWSESHPPETEGPPPPFPDMFPGWDWRGSSVTRSRTHSLTAS